MSNSVGIDVGTFAIKVVELKKVGKTFEVVKAVAAPNNTGVVVPSSAKDRQQLIDQIKAIFRDFKISTINARIGLPESFMSTKIISVPVLSDAELATAIPWQAEQYIPIAADDLQLEYEVLYRPPKTAVSEQMRVLLLGASKNMLQTYVSMFSEAGIEIEIVETQMLSLFRLLMQDKEQKITLLVNFGAATMDMLVQHQGEFAFVYTYPNGGAVLSRAVEKTLGLDPTQAEAYKRAYGLDETQLEGKVGLAMQPVFKSFITELQKALQYFSGAHQGVAVQRLLFTGGSSALPNLIPVVAQSLQAEVGLFSPLELITLGKGVELTPIDAQAYAVAIGLAMGGKP